MLLTRLVIVALGLVPVLASAAEFGCPVHSGRHLISATLFDGPPSEHADLMPDHDRKIKGGGQSEWNVAYIFQAGRKLYVECQYGSKMPSTILEAPKVETCTYYTNANRRNSLTCK